MSRSSGVVIISDTSQVAKPAPDLTHWQSTDVSGYLIPKPLKCTYMYPHTHRLRHIQTSGRMARMERHATGVTGGPERGPLSPCVCSTLRMVSRAVTQLYDDILRPSGLRVTQFSILATIARRGEANLRH